MSMLDAVIGVKLYFPGTYHAFQGSHLQIMSRVEGTVVECYSDHGQWIVNIGDGNVTVFQFIIGVLDLVRYRAVDESVQAKGGRWRAAKPVTHNVVHSIMSERHDAIAEELRAIPVPEGTTVDMVVIDHLNGNDHQTGVNAPVVLQRWANSMPRQVNAQFVLDRQQIGVVCGPLAVDQTVQIQLGGSTPLHAMDTSTWFRGKDPAVHRGFVEAVNILELHADYKWKKYLITRRPEWHVGDGPVGLDIMTVDELSKILKGSGITSLHSVTDRKKLKAAIPTDSDGGILDTGNMLFAIDAECLSVDGLHALLWTHGYGKRIAGVWACRDKAALLEAWDHMKRTAPSTESTLQAPNPDSGSRNVNVLRPSVLLSDLYVRSP